MSFFCSCVTRASRRSSLRERRSTVEACFIPSSSSLSVYGESPDKSIYVRHLGVQFFRHSLSLIYRRNTTPSFLSHKPRDSSCCFFEGRKSGRTCFPDTLCHRRVKPTLMKRTVRSQGLARQ